MHKYHIDKRGNKENGEIHGLLTKHRDFCGCIFPLLLLKSAEAVTLIAVICIIFGVQQNKEPGCRQTVCLCCAGQGPVLGESK